MGQYLNGRTLSSIYETLGSILSTVTKKVHKTYQAHVEKRILVFNWIPTSLTIYIPDMLLANSPYT